MGGFQRPRDPHLSDQITRLGSQDVGAREFISVSVKNDFDEPLTATNGQGFTPGAQRKTAHTNSPSRLTRRLFGHPHTRYLRLAVGAARDILVVHTRIIEPGNGFDGRNTFGGSHVRPARLTIDIANGVNARHIRPAVRIDGDKSTLAVYASRLEPEVLDVALYPDGHQDVRALHGPRALGSVHLHLHTIGRDLGTLHPTPHVYSDALLFQRFLQQPGNLTVLNGQHLRQHLDERHLRAKSVIEIRKLYPYRSCANDPQGLLDIL